MRLFFILLSSLAHGFSAAPSRSCKVDGDCVLVRETYCGEIASIALGLDEEWAEWDKKNREKRSRSKERCEREGPLPQPHQYDARCVKGECAAIRKAL